MVRAHWRPISSLERIGDKSVMDCQRSGCLGRIGVVFLIECQGLGLIGDLLVA